jgi:hypothetical protein
MQTDEMIPANDFCIHHNIELSFIYSLGESGLIEIINREEETYLPLSQLNQLEKLVHMYYELEINLEGIETITYLLNRMNDLQQQVASLHSRLRLYESE